MINELCFRLSSISKKNNKKKLVLFFGREHFSDNTKYLFLHTQSKECDFEAVWCSTERKLITTLKENNLPCHLISDETSSETVKLFLSAAVAVFSVNPSQSLNGSEELFSCLDGARQIQLWHGVSVKHLLLKLVPYLDVLSYDFRRPVDFATRADGVLSTSEHLDVFFKESFGCQNIIRAGYPRNEVIVREAIQNELIGCELPVNVINALNSTKRRKILFVPTWQREGSALITNSSEFALQLVQYGKLLEADVFIKNHPINVHSSDTKALAENVFFINANTDLYPYLNKFDILVTDYSSIMFDFLLTKKPILKLELDLGAHRSFEPDYSLVPDIDFAYSYTQKTLSSRLSEAMFNDTKQELRNIMAGLLYQTPVANACNSLVRFLEDEVETCVAESNKFTVKYC
jgi:CDP-glycerol glycerophosphotransferase (TagB/SpsB family)